eukprot:gene33469-43255_t
MKRNAASKIKSTTGSSSRPATNTQAPSFISWILSNIFLLLKVGAVLFAALFAVIIWRKSTSVIKNLVNADAEALKSAIFGDVPHLFYCDRGGIGKGVSNSDRIPGIFTDLHAIKGSEMGFATLNCSRVLPSGKSIWDRFKIKKEWRPTIFGTAPWMKPKQAGPNYLKDLASLRKFVEVAMAPRGTDISSDKQLVKFCGFDKNVAEDDSSVTDTCFVLMKGSRFSKAQADLEAKLVRQYPKLKIASIDGTKRRLSFEDYEDLTPDIFSIQLHALRNGTHYLTMQYPATSDYLSTFISRSNGLPLGDFIGDGTETIRLIDPVKAAAAKRNKEAQAAAKSKKAAASKTAGKTSTSTGKKEGTSAGDGSDVGGAGASSGSSTTASGEEKAPEISEAERVRRERQRREEMERQEKEHVFSGGEEDEGDGGGGDSAEEASEEEEYIEL